MGTAKGVAGPAGWLPGRMRIVQGRTDHVVVVGAGLAGLSAAMHLAGAGRRVTVLERGDLAGGRAAPLHLPGENGQYRFDPGPTVLTMPDLIADCFEALGESMEDRLTLRPLFPLYRAHFADSSTLQVHSDVEATAAEIAGVIGGQEAEGFRRYVGFVSRLYRYEMQDFIDRNMDTPLDLFTGNLARLAAIGGFGRLAPAVARYLKDPRTQRLFSFQALYAGVSPYRALALYAVIAYMDSVGGVFFPEGGMGAVARAMTRAAAEHGVEFRYGTEVTRVEVQGRRAVAVRTAQGERIRCDAVVLNPDLPVAYRDLLGHVPWHVRRLRFSPSCYLMLAGSRAHYPNQAHHTIHFGRAWRRVFEDLDCGRPMSDPSFLVTNPTGTEPSLAPPDRQIYYVLFPVPNLDAPVDWQRIGPAYREHVLSTLHAHGYEGFAEGIEVEQVFTPLEWERSGLARGTPFAAAHTLNQTGPFRPGNLWGENVVLAGSGTRPGVGVPMVLISGRLAAERITGPRSGYRSRAWR
ncbi:MAG: phytoene desaturase [Actinomycetota bacterium]|nr:phytoene desaturase [Actinomycetota bacterium]